MKKYISILILIGVCAMIFWGLNSKDNKYSKMYSQTKILTGNKDSYSFKNRNGGWEGDEVDLKCEFSGVNTLGDIEIKEPQDIELIYNISVKKGKFKVILTSESNILFSIEGSNSGKQKVTLPKGKYSMKIVGDHTQANLKLAVVKGEGAEITPRSTSIFDEDWM